MKRVGIPPNGDPYMRVYSAWIYELVRESFGAKPDCCIATLVHIEELLLLRKNDYIQLIDDEVDD